MWFVSDDVGVVFVGDDLVTVDVGDESDDVHHCYRPLLRVHLHMAKNLPTSSRRILNEHSANSPRRKILRRRRILTPNFNFNFNFSAKFIFSYF